MKKILLLVLLSVCIKVQAITRTAVVNNGAWASPATWSGNAVPGAADTAVIPVGIRVVANLGTVFKVQWNNAKAIYVHGTFELIGNDPVFFNPTTIDVYNGGTFYDHTDFAEYYLTPVSTLIVRLGAICQHTGSFTSSNILSTNAASVPPNYTIPAPVTPPFTLTINASTITYTGSVPLPLELVGFSAAQQGKQVQLNWQTAEEKQTAYFEIERSGEGRQFEKIGRIAAAGAGGHDYASSDPAPLDGGNLYRLKMLDRDGSTRYSNTISLFFMTVSDDPVLYPNPAGDLLQVNVSEAQMLHIYNTSGQLVWHRQIEKGTTVLDIRTLAKGLYYVDIKGKPAKFVKDR